jgi:S1-C subfamily serine protease
VRFDSGRVHVGREPGSHLQLDPDRDLDVSGVHAVLHERAGDWWLQDLGSRNGTFVGEERVTGERRLAHGDRLRLGSGVEILVRLPAETPTAGAHLERLARQNTWLWRGLAGAALLLGVVAAVLVVAWERRDAAWERERSALTSRMDSLLATSRRTIDALEGEVGGLATALETSRSDVIELQRAVRVSTARGDEGEVEGLRQRLQDATVALERQQLAASLDFAMIERRNRPALAMVFVELEPGAVSTATAFGVRSDGTLVTSRHAVRRPDTGEPARIAVQFADSRQVWRARLIAASEDWDLALLKVDDIDGATPVVAGLNASPDTLAGGTPVALIGFPLASRADSPSPLVTAGVVRAWGPGDVRVQGYGAEGASGSPILDADGRVVAVLYGGTGADAERTLLGVPARAVVELLERAGSSSPASRIRSP